MRLKGSADRHLFIPGNEVEPSVALQIDLDRNFS
jgi:hypothetical protein